MLNMSVSLLVNSYIYNLLIIIISSVLKALYKCFNLRRYILQDDNLK